MPAQTPVVRPLSLRPGRLLVAASLSFSVGFGGCAIDPLQDERRVLADVSAQSLGRARALEDSGEPAKAADAYLELAEGAPSPAREQLELNAAEALLSAGKAAEADRVLKGVNQGKLTATQRQMVLLLDGEVALQRGRAVEAIGKLQRVRQGALPGDLKVRRLGTLAAAYRLNGEPIKAAESLGALGKLLDEPGARLDNQVSLLFTLSTLGPSGLKQEAAKGRGRIRGWAEIAVLFGHYGAASSELDRRYRQWRSSHLTHPAMADLPRAYFATLAGGYAPGTDALVLLPSGGRFGVAADAIRDGIRAAYGADSSANRPSIGYRGSGRSAYQNGVDNGADLVIGPLEKSAVDALAKGPSLPVPTLALNRTSVVGGAPENLYQFSLAPEDEAVNAASYAWASGLRQPLLLYPEGLWGDRMAQAFRRQWRTLGGKIAGEQGYTGDGGRDALALLIGSQGDFVFLVASTGDVVGLWSAIQDAGGGRIPVVATSHIYAGDFDPARDAALSGLYFVDIPWILDLDRSDALSRKGLREKLPNVSGPLARLYAMGIDAYRLAPRIGEMGRNPGTFFPGETGGLNVDSLGRIRRQLVLARFTGSGPVVQERIEVTARPKADPKLAAATDAPTD